MHFCSSSPRFFFQMNTFFRQIFSPCHRFFVLLFF
ncbi:ribonuclease P [Listeria monocytogenes]|nr:ribonuclease P [Listeria monocytogenes]GAT42049.1 ribonuclease P [Listeria monocytogenes]